MNDRMTETFSSDRGGRVTVVGSVDESRECKWNDGGGQKGPKYANR